ncbi:pickpocket protein 28-like [Condylostylus longicornis]|uniref:pickpocket protein 28-like n=1 Tax=Condylostylus longicornis TaxID=2530218 RepID=UPI00244DAE1C|nr:pickpocket protein 28-like [Condylostylus longicornis]XP_055382469.1 pickpocket protein 28-like [Condylostylus longicornis]
MAKSKNLNGLNADGPISENDDSTSNISNISSANSEPLPEFIDVIQKGKTKEFYKAMFAEYCECSTIHGVRYIGERRRSWIERVFWLIIFGISIYICVTLIQNIWKKWHSTPVIVSFADKSTPIWQIPMPTITICPDNKSNSSLFRFENYEAQIRENISNYDTWNRQEKRFMDINLQVCDYTDKDFFNFTDKVYKGNFLKELKKLYPKPDFLFPITRFDDVMAFNDYKQFFDIVVTEFGVCYSFNMLPLENIYKKRTVTDELINFAHDGDQDPETVLRYDRSTTWTLETGFSEDGNQLFPYRMYNSVMENGLLILIYGRKSDIDPICGEGDEGFKFAVSTPGDIPQLSKQYSSVPFSYEVLVDITPELITTDETAVDYSPKIRQCFYENERRLAYFQSYSQANCEFECLTNYTLAKCKCVRFNMPRAKNTHTCGAAKISCYQEAKRELMEKDFQQSTQNNTKNKVKVPDCDCLPSCTTLSYSYGITQAPLQEDIDEEDEYRTTKFLIYFKDNRFWSQERAKLYGVIDFTANAGGLLGLFMGISILSFVELFYFISVRLIGNIKLRYCSGVRRNIEQQVHEIQRRFSNVSETFRNEYNF